jgi:hypothetical protein
MNWDAIGAVGELVGATAVVVSLIYLAIQIRRQSEDSRVSSMNDVAAAFRDASGKTGDADFADIAFRGLRDFDSLAGPEKLSMLVRMINVFRVCEEAYILHQDGRLDERYWRGIQRYLATAIGAPGAQRVWELRKHYFSDEFQAYVQGLERIEWDGISDGS